MSGGLNTPSIRKPDLAAWAAAAKRVLALAHARWVLAAAGALLLAGILGYLYYKTQGADFKRKSEALAALSRSELGNTTGFSPQFIGLARQRLAGLWLTHIALGGPGLELRGITLSEELLPRYLDMLGHEPVFQGTRFGEAHLTRSADPAGLSFELRSHGIAAPQAGVTAQGGAGS